MEGEDLIVYDKLKNIDNGFYVDAGCYHPLHINNTFLLYKKGWRGIYAAASLAHVHKVFAFVLAQTLDGHVVIGWVA